MISPLSNRKSPRRLAWYATQCMNRGISCTFILVCFIACGPVFSADGISAENAKSLDTDQDGKLSLAEFLAGKENVPERRQLFFQYDTNEDFSLSTEEVTVKTPKNTLSLINGFRFQDRNDDGGLTLEEYLSSKTITNPKLAERNYKIVDFNGNGQLTLEEYKALPGLLPLEKRSDIPDPIADLANEAQQKWQKLQKTADKDANGQLSQAEWPLVELQNQLTPLADVKFSVWDADKNGQVTSEEAEQLISTAYGMREVNGAPLRFTNGLVLYRSFIQPTDKDGDYRLSKAEYLPSIRRPQEMVLAEFAKMDSDKDDFLTYPEMTKSNTTSVDEFSYFVNSDKDLDGLLSPKELLNINSNGAFKSRLPQGFAAFDQDGDGKLNLREFRFAPIGCSYITLRIYGRSDLDHDAALSWQEFYQEDSPQLIGVAWEMFRRFDRNQSGKLELDEIEFGVDPTRISPEKAFTFRDKNADGGLSLEEYLPLVASTNLDLAKRNFKVVDFDNNNQLSFEEYQAIPGLLTVEKRGTIPDPVAEFASVALKKWQELQKRADQDADGQLSKAEWPLAEIQKQLTPLADVEFTVWDTDMNGQVSSKEAEQLIAIAYGMQQVNGAPLRTTNGRVLYRFYINRTDIDKDYRISKAEYLPSIRLPKEKVLANFNNLDRDQDQYLTYSELQNSTSTNIDEFNYFLSSDKDLDGFLNLEELLKVGSNSSAKKTSISQAFAAFDEDKDGKFSLREFRLAPIGICYVTLRVYDRKDLDHDGTLSWKEFYQEPSPQVIGLAWELFQRFDRNKNGQLETNEFEFLIDPAKLPPEKTFASKDKDADGMLSLQEYLLSVPAANPQLARRDFHVSDFDRNGKLKLEEYKTLTGLFPAQTRGEIPDPVVELAAIALKKWQKLLKSADRNADDQLSQSEWPRIKLQSDLPGLSEVIFPYWDRNRDGQVNFSEAKRLIDIAYGIQNVNGDPLRTPNGLVLYRSYIKPTDRNRDHRLSRGEYASSLRQPIKKVLELFSSMDIDEDGFLTYPELTISSTTNIDEFNYFLNTDKNLDGFLSPEELVKINSNGVVEERLPQGMVAFDEDHDGQYSLREFRLSPVGCSYVTLRVYGRKDLDHDGMLSWKEFYQEEAPEVIGLAWELFQRFDRNKNKQLEINEFEFYFNPTEVAPKLYFQFADKDKNGLLSIDEVFTDKEPENQTTQAYERFRINQKRAKEKFAQDDRNNDHSLNEAEFILAHETAREIHESHLRALGRLPTSTEGPKWLFPAIMTFNIVLLIGIAVFFIRRKVR